MNAVDTRRLSSARKDVVVGVLGAGRVWGTRVMKGRTVKVFGAFDQEDVKALRALDGVLGVRLITGWHDGFCLRVSPKVIVVFKEV